MPFALSWLVSVFALAAAWNEPSCTTSRLPPTAAVLWAVAVGALLAGAETGVGGRAAADAGSVAGASGLRFMGFGGGSGMERGAVEASWVAVASSAGGALGASATLGTDACRLASGVGSART